MTWSTFACVWFSYVHRRCGCCCRFFLRYIHSIHFCPIRCNAYLYFANRFFNMLSKDAPDAHACAKIFRRPTKSSSRKQLVLLGWMNFTLRLQCHKKWNLKGFDHNHLLSMSAAYANFWYSRRNTSTSVSILAHSSSGTNNSFAVSCKMRCTSSMASIIRKTTPWFGWSRDFSPHVSDWRKEVLCFCAPAPKARERRQWFFLVQERFQIKISVLGGVPWSW